MFGQNRLNAPGVLLCSRLGGILLHADRGKSSSTLGECTQGSIYIKTARCLCAAVGPGQEDGSLSEAPG